MPAPQIKKLWAVLPLSHRDLHPYRGWRRRRHVRLPPPGVCRLFFGGFFVKSLKSRVLCGFREQDSCFLVRSFCESVANTVLIVFLSYFGLNFQDFVWKVQKNASGFVLVALQK